MGVYCIVRGFYCNPVLNDSHGMLQLWLQLLDILYILWYSEQKMFRSLYNSNLGRRGTEACVQLVH
jgi:hypothetical protein